MQQLLSTYNIVSAPTHKLCRNPADAASCVLWVEDVTPHNPITLYQYSHLLHCPQETGCISSQSQQHCQL